MRKKGKLLLFATLCFSLAFGMTTPISAFEEQSDETTETQPTEVLEEPVIEEEAATKEDQVLILWLKRHPYKKEQ